MRRHSVVPNYNGARSPLHTSLKILTLGDMIIQELQQEVALLLLISQNSARELWVHEDRLLTR